MLGWLDSWAHRTGGGLRRPRWLWRWVCDRREAQVLGGLYEDDEPLEDVLAAMDRSDSGVVLASALSTVRRTCFDDLTTRPTAQGVSNRRSRGPTSRR